MGRFGVYYKDKYMNKWPNRTKYIQKRSLVENNSVCLEDGVHIGRERQRRYDSLPERLCWSCSIFQAPGRYKAPYSMLGAGSRQSVQPLLSGNLCDFLILVLFCE